MIRAFFDGACGPKNPGGRTSYGAVIYMPEKFSPLREVTISEIFTPPADHPEMLSNNVGEYAGFLAVLKWLKEAGHQNEEIQVYGDSNLVVMQMTDVWKIKKGLYVSLALEARELIKEFPNLTIGWVPREKNTVADKLSKAVLKGGE